MSDKIDERADDRLANSQPGDTVELLTVKLEDDMSPEEIKTAIKTVLEEMDMEGFDVDEYANDELVSRLVEAETNVFSIMQVEDAAGNMIVTTVEVAGNYEIYNGTEFTDNTGPVENGGNVQAVDYQDTKAGIEIASGTVQVEEGGVDADRLEAIRAALGDPAAEINNSAPEASSATTEAPQVTVQVDKLGM